jgi:hypothetical protein
VRPLYPGGDGLPAAITQIRRWVEADPADQARVVLGELSLPGAEPAAYVAGFELLLQTAPDLVDLVDAFLDLPDRPAAATRGLLDRVYLATAPLQAGARARLAERLLVGMAREAAPAALLGYLIWLDAYADSLALARHSTVEAELGRIERLSFVGPEDQLWRRPVEAQIASLRGKLAAP